MSYNVPVHLIRQYLFCPRIPYFLVNHHLQIEHPLWTIQGNAYHKTQLRLMNRRSAARFGLENVSTDANVYMWSDTYLLHGIMDYILLGAHEIYPVEFKLHGTKPSYSQIMQLVAYSILAEEKYNKPCQTAFFMYGEKGKTIPIAIDNNKRTQLTNIIDSLVKSLEGILPDSSATEAQCTQCEFFSHCNDRL